MDVLSTAYDTTPDPLLGWGGGYHRSQRRPGRLWQFPWACF